MQGEDFRAGKVIPALKAGRKLDVKETVVVNDFVSTPAVGGGVVAMFEDLEPAIASSYSSLLVEPH